MANTTTLIYAIARARGLARGLRVGLDAIKAAPAYDARKALSTWTIEYALEIADILDVLASEVEMPHESRSIESSAPTPTT